MSYLVLLFLRLILELGRNGTSANSTQNAASDQVLHHWELPRPILEPVKSKWILLFDKVGINGLISMLRSRKFVREGPDLTMLF